MDITKNILLHTDFLCFLILPANYDRNSTYYELTHNHTVHGHAKQKIFNPDRIPTIQNQTYLKNKK